MSDFRSDTVTQPTAGMRLAMQQAQLGDDVFGDDPAVNSLQHFAASQFGFAQALFAPSGTMTNLIALMAHCQRGDEAIVGQQWHTYKWEAGGMAVLGSIQPQPLPHQPDGSIALHDIAAAIKPDDFHFARTKLVVIENTTGGQVLSTDYMRQVATLCHERKLACHIDGARILNAAVALAGPAADPWPVARQLVQGYDSISVCLSKGLGAPVGSLLLGSSEFIAKARRIRKMLGGGMRQAGMLAAAGEYALRHQVIRLADDHQHAAQLAAGLAELVQKLKLQADFQLSPVQTNILFAELTPELATFYQQQLAEQGILCTAGSYVAATGVRTRLRFVTHLGICADDIAHMLQQSAAILARWR